MSLSLDTPRVRIDALDSVRALLMLLGLYIHSAAPYRDHAPWLIDDVGGSGALYYSTIWLSEFRMPAFYFLAGLLAAWAVARRAPVEFLTRRALRLGLPLVVVALSLNALQATLLAQHADAYCHGESCAVQMHAALWLGHLWFLLDLLLYTAVLVLAWSGMQRMAAVVATRVERLGGLLGPATVVVSAMLALALWRLGAGVVTMTFPALREPLLGFWSFTWVAEHAFFFFAGAGLALLAPFRVALARPVRASLPIVTGLLGTAAFAAFTWADPGRDSTVAKVVNTVASAAPRVLLVTFAITAGMMLHARIAPLMRAIAQYSYSVYLFHHIVVVVAALALLGVAMPIGGKFAIVFVVAVSASLGVAVLIERVPLLRLLLNGEDRAAATPAASAPAQVAQARAALLDAQLPGLAANPDAVTLLSGPSAGAPTPTPSSRESTVHSGQRAARRS